VILTRRLAERLWPDEDALGKRIAWPEPGGTTRPPFDVIGVAADAKYRSLIGDAPLLMYVPLLAEYDSRTHIVVRTASDPASVIAEIDHVARNIDPDVPIYDLETMAEHTAESLWQQRTAAGWIGAFSLIAVILAGVGLYAVIAQSVAQRTREVGIRMALGAAPGSVSRLVIRGDDACFGRDCGGPTRCARLGPDHAPFAGWNQWGGRAYLHSHRPRDRDGNVGRLLATRAPGR
jgi:hypothetical protein